MDISGIDYLAFDRLLKRGSREIIVEQDDALFIRDSISGGYFLACETPEIGLSLLDCQNRKGCDLLMVTDHSLGKTAFSRYGFTNKLECYQVAYFGEKPSWDDSINVRTADVQDLDMIVENYKTLCPEELEKVVKRKSVLIGCHQGREVGFIGEHLEGSMGMLHVFPEYRNRGFGTALQKHLMVRTMERGFIPFAQVEKENLASLNLQKKIGMTQSENLFVWMWR